MPGTSDAGSGIGGEVLARAALPDVGRGLLPVAPGGLRELRDGRVAGEAVAIAKAELEARLALDPRDYGALVALGELKLRVGLAEEARALLYRAILLPPPSWEAYQWASALLRSAEDQARHAFARPPGAPPPELGLRRLPKLLARLTRRDPRAPGAREERARR